MLGRVANWLPRPTRATFAMVAVALVVAAALVVGVLLPARDAASDARAAAARDAAALDAERDILADFNAGAVLSGPELAARVGVVDTLLPDAASAPPIDAPRALAAGRGLQVTSYSFAANYKPADPAGSYPGLAVASGAMTVVGPPADIIAFFGDLEAFPQLVTFTSSGIDKNSASLQVWLWASQDPTFPLG